MHREYHKINFNCQHHAILLSHSKQRRDNTSICDRIVYAYNWTTSDSTLTTQRLIVVFNLGVTGHLTDQDNMARQTSQNSACFSNNVWVPRNSDGRLGRSRLVHMAHPFVFSKSSRHRLWRY